MATELSIRTPRSLEGRCAARSWPALHAAITELLTIDHEVELHSVGRSITITRTGPVATITMEARGEQLFPLIAQRWELVAPYDPSRGRDGRRAGGRAVRRSFAADDAALPTRIVELITEGVRPPAPEELRFRTESEAAAAALRAPRPELADDETPRCARCGNDLGDAVSAARGYGPYCWDIRDGSRRRSVVRR